MTTGGVMVTGGDDDHRDGVSKTFVSDAYQPTGTDMPN